MDKRFANYDPRVLKAWASVHFELTTFAKEKRVLRKRPPQKRLDSEVTFHPKPRGRAPEGKSWDPIHGEWIDMSPSKVKKQSKKEKKGNPNNMSSLESNPSSNQKSEKVPRPKGRPPKNTYWNETTGRWEPNEETVAQRRSRSLAKQPQTGPSKPNTTSPLNTQQRQSANKAMIGSTNARPQMPSPKRLEQTLEENLGGNLLALHSTPPPVKRSSTKNTTSPKRVEKRLEDYSGGNLALATTPPSPVKRTKRDSHRVISPKQKLLIQKGDALATMWGVQTKGKSPTAKTERKTSEQGRVPEKSSGGLLAEVSITRKRKVEPSEKKKQASKKGRTSASKNEPDHLYKESKRSLIQKEDGTFARPPGKPPQGFSWDAKGGAWVADESALVKPKQRAAQEETATLKSNQCAAEDNKILTSRLKQGTATEGKTRADKDEKTTLELKQRTIKDDKITLPRKEVQKQSVVQKKGNTVSVLQQGSIGVARSPTKSPAKDMKRNESHTSAKNNAKKTVSSTESFSISQRDNGSYLQSKSKAPVALARVKNTGPGTQRLDAATDNYASSRKRKQPEVVDRPLQSALKKPKFAQPKSQSPDIRFNNSPRSGTTTSALASPAYRASPKKTFHSSGGMGSPDVSRGIHRSRSWNQSVYGSGRSRKDSRMRRRSINFVAHAPINATQAIATESHDYVACGDCLNCRLPINCGACLLCKNSLHFGSFFPSCVRRICVSPVLPPLQRVSMVHFSARSPTSPVGSPPRQPPRKLVEAGSGLLGSFGQYRDKEDDSADESEPALSKASVQTDEITDVVESLHADSDDDISDF